MLVGYLGAIPFIVSREYIRTFSDFSRESAGRWAKHDIIGDKPVLEFLGPDIEKISFKMQLRSDNGLNPRKELEVLRKLRDDGTPIPLIIGGRPVTDNMWVVESLGEAVTFWTAGGAMQSVNVDVSLQEYVDGSVI